MENEIFKKIAEKLKNLPTLPAVAAKILEVTDDPDTTIGDLKRIISMDQVVASRLLRAVNSAYYGFPRTIDSLQQAIVILGFNNVRSLALSVSVMDFFASRQPGGAPGLADLWVHSVGTAFIARALARARMPQLTEQCFVAGLLHDIGFVPIDQVSPSNLKLAMKISNEKKCPFYIAEKEVMGFSHADVGAYMAEHWLLPSSLKESIGSHHELPQKPEHTEILFAVHAADQLVHIKGFCEFETGLAPTFNSIDQRARDFFKIKDTLPRDIEEFIAGDLEQAYEMAAILK